MSVKRVTPEEAADLVNQGWTMVDVRSIPEFDAGHPAGAYNVPLLRRGGAGLTPNPDFLGVMKARFATAVNLVMTCRSGGRSLRAAKALVDNGYTSVVDMRGGFGGETQGGVVSFEGWQARGLPVANQPEAGRSYDALKDGV